MFEQQLGTLLRRDKALNNQVAVMLMDLDQFKLVNDTLGHAVGDGLLKQFAIKLQECLNEGQTVYRLSGDEFCIILTQIASHDDIQVFPIKFSK